MHTHTRIQSLPTIYIAIIEIENPFTFHNIVNPVPIIISNTRKTFFPFALLFAVLEVSRKKGKCEALS